jgi:hypothetical protein
MDVTVMGSAQRYREFIADLESHCSRLSEAQMVGVSGTSAADQTRLRCNELEMAFKALGCQQIAIAQNRRHRSSQWHGQSHHAPPAHLRGVDLLGLASLPDIRDIGTSPDGGGALETTFHQDLNGDGTIGIPVIQTVNGVQLGAMSSAVTVSMTPSFSRRPSVGLVLRMPRART